MKPSRRGEDRWGGKVGGGGSPQEMGSLKGGKKNTGLVKKIQTQANIKGGERKTVEKEKRKLLR